MKRSLLITLFFSVLFVQASFAEPDSLYIYQGDKILYKEALSQIDSLTVLPEDYYHKKASLELYTRLSAYPQISLFVKMIDICDYETTLVNYDVFAPVNESLEAVDLSNTAIVKQIVDNHLSKQMSGYLINGKYYKTIFSDGTYQSISGTRILEWKEFKSGYQDFSYNSLYILENQIPYKYNYIQYINQSTGLDSMKQFLQSKQRIDLLEYLAAIDKEDKENTFLLPTDSAWKEAFDVLYPLCKTPEGTIKQIENTRWSIVRDNFFEGRITIPYIGTSLQATSRYTYTQPDSLNKYIVATTDLSNGICYTVSRLPKLDDLFQEVRIEAENSTFRKSSFLRLYAITDTITDTAYVFSKNIYLQCNPQTTYSNGNVSWGLLGLVPGVKYNVFLLTVPGSVENAANQKSNKLSIALTYRNHTGTLVSDSVIISNYITKPTGITKIPLLSNFVFPYVDTYIDPTIGPTERIQVSNSISYSEIKKETYDASMRIDCLIFEPVLHKSITPN